MTADDKPVLMANVIQDTDAWKEGYAAGRRGLTVSANPYPRRGLKAPRPQGAAASRPLSWYSGLIKGQNKRLAVAE
jgi:hypothetical protein